MPDWVDTRIGLRSKNGMQTARIFTIPGDEFEFKEFVLSVLRLSVHSDPSDGNEPQLPLFDDE
jgi:hypothetical protein